MAITAERVTITLPAEFCDRLRNQYPHRDFSGLVFAMLIYADMAGFMKRLDDLDPADYQNILPPLERAKKPIEPPTKRQIEEALEIFGS